MALLCGWLGDRIGRKAVLVGCVASFGIMSMLTAAIDTKFWLTMARFGTGLGPGGGILLSHHAAFRCVWAQTSGWLRHRVTCAVTLGNVLGGFGAARLIGPYGWRSVFVTEGIGPPAADLVLAARVARVHAVSPVGTARRPDTLRKEQSPSFSEQSSPFVRCCGYQLFKPIDDLLR